MLAWTEQTAVPLLNENENESNRFGYHVKCSVADDVTASIEVSSIAAAAVDGISLQVEDEKGHRMDMRVAGTYRKDGVLVLIIHLPKVWAEKSMLIVLSGSYDGSASVGPVDGKLVVGYSLSFKNALKQ